jgi:hypothetical protein
MRVALLVGTEMKPTLQRVLLIVALFIIGAMLVYLPYRIHIAAGFIHSLVLGVLLPLCPFTAAVFLAIGGTPDRVQPFKAGRSRMEYLRLHLRSRRAAPR